jgi:hypothetical protein
VGIYSGFSNYDTDPKRALRLMACLGNWTIRAILTSMIKIEQVAGVRRRNGLWVDWNANGTPDEVSEVSDELSVDALLSWCRVFVCAGISAVQSISHRKLQRLYPLGEEVDTTYWLSHQEWALPLRHEGRFLHSVCGLISIPYSGGIVIIDYLVCSQDRKIQYISSGSLPCSIVK